METAIAEGDLRLLSAMPANCLAPLVARAFALVQCPRFKEALLSLDVNDLLTFYASPLGEVARRLVGRVVRSRWDNCSGLAVAALGYGAPFLERYREEARRCLVLMPAEQGVAVWPSTGRSSSALVDMLMLPLPDASIDRILVVHALEMTDDAYGLLEEVWRIMAPGGRTILVVPSRRGVWARIDATPFGQGQPYSKTQLRELLQRALFSPVFWGEALYAPPIARNFVVRSAPGIERIGSAFGLPFAGVHIVEAIKQVYRPVGVRRTARARFAPLRPALAPSPQS